MRSTAEVLYNKHQETAKVAQASVVMETAKEEAPRAQTVLKVDLIRVSPFTNADCCVHRKKHQHLVAVQTFSLHIGADLRIPTVDKRKTHVVEIQPRLSPTERAAASDPFAGLPLKAWADR